MYNKYIFDCSKTKYTICETVQTADEEDKVALKYDN